MTTVLSVAKKDFSDAARAFSLWVATLLLVGAVCAVYFFIWGASDIPEPRLDHGIMAIMYPIQFLIGLIALLIGFGAIVGERTTGSIKFLLGLPPTRGDMFFGKFIGRFLVLAVAIIVTFIAVSGLSAATYGEIPLSEFGPLLLFSLLLGAVWTSIVVTLSALSASRTRVIAACISIWLLFVVLWEILLSIIHLLIEGAFPEAMGPDLVAEPTWMLVLQRLNPVEAFAIVSSEYVGPTILPALFTFITGAQRGEYTITERYHGQEGATEVPFFLEGEIALIILLAWVLIPLAIGYLRFRSVDL
ncbi:ABC-2 type transporter [Natrialba chahannaoensis JCM 10990]|uniref:ABC-2 type transporter n=1 Tax=Natrialba chahannaoensis JCM 10990 TaxID=1227492 RepID=M0AES0_9EURY|nr:ABC transporter permease subunit [Natrialba chahannaoensis]ELY96999.1 ABC-2 type transporter [Natrialba chahannaoensis JCM 10990]